MKKSIHEFRRFLFATIMLLGVGVTAWGTETTIFEWSSTSGSAANSVTNSYGTISGTTGSAAEATVNVKQSNYYTLKLQGKNDFSTNHIVITLAEEVSLKKGDVLTINGFSNNSSKDSYPSVKFTDSYTETINASFANMNTSSANYNQGNLKDAVSVELGEDAEGVTSFKLTRGSTGTNFFVTNISIVRSGEGGNPEPECTTPTIAWGTEPAGGEVGAADVTATVTTTPADATITWLSSNTAVATVDNGTIHFVAAGTTTITAKFTGDGTTYCDDEVSVQKEITVTEPASTGTEPVALMKGTYTLTGATSTSNKVFGATNNIYIGRNGGSTSIDGNKGFLGSKSGCMIAFYLGEEAEVYFNVNASKAQTATWSVKAISADDYAGILAQYDAATNASTYYSNSGAEICTITGTTTKSESVTTNRTSTLAAGYYGFYVTTGADALYVKDVVIAAPAVKHSINYAETKGADMSAYPTQYEEGVGVASFAPLANVTGWDFVAWSPASISAEATEDVTITATWIEATAYTVTYALGEEAIGTLPTEGDHYQGEKFNVAAQGDIKKDGYDFTGWNDGTNTYAAGAEYTVGTANVVLTAQWTVKTVSDKKQLTRVKFSNGFDAFVKEGDHSVTAYYLGETEPTVVADSWTVSEKATATVEDGKIVVTAEDGTTQDYAITLTKVEPYATEGDLTFDDKESGWIKTGNSWSASKGWTLSKSLDEATNMRVAEGKNRLNLFVDACAEIVLTTATSTNRAIAVYRNGELLDAPTTTGTTDNKITIACDIENPCFITIVNTKGEGGGDAGFKAITLNKTIAPTCPASVAISGEKTCYIGGNLELTATQTGSNTPENVTYQWYKDETIIEGATNATFSKSGLVAEDAGSYVCKVNQEGCEEVASAVYAITVKEVLVTGVTVEGTVTRVKMGETFQLTAVVAPANATNKTVTWVDNDYMSCSDENPTTVTPIKPGKDKIIKAKAGTKTSDSYKVTVYSVVTYVTNGAEAIADAEYDGNTSLTLPSPVHPDGYPFLGWYSDAEFTNKVGAAGMTSYKPQDNITLYAKWELPNAETPEITTQPQGKEYAYGTTEFDALTVVAAPATAYQWYKGGVVIDGATEATYTPTEAGTYYVKVTNSEANHNDVTVTSDNAVITIAAPAEGYTQSEVTGTTTWDWTKTETVDQDNSNGVVMANISGITNDENFNSQALVVTCDYAARLDKSAKYFQGTRIEFTTTVDGLVMINYRSTAGDETIDLQVNGKTVGTKQGAWTLSEPIFVPAGNVVITMDGTKQKGRINKIVFSTESTTHNRSLSGKMGTHCYPFTIPAGGYAGAHFYTPAYREGDTKIFWDEVTGDIEAGKPYLMVPEEDATELVAEKVYTVNATEVKAQSINGFVGSYSQTLITEDDCYIVYENQFRLVEASAYVYVGANRAYVDLYQMDNNETPAPVGARRFVMNNANSQTVTTGLENASDNADIRKVMINGQLFIIRGEKMYNVEGQLVK